MKAYLDWLDAEQRVTSQEVPLEGLSIGLETGAPGVHVGEGAAAAPTSAQCEIRWDGRRATVTVQGSEISLAGHRVGPGQTVALNNMTELVLGPTRLRFRRVPAAPTVEGRDTPEIDLSTLRADRLIIGRHKEGTPDAPPDGRSELRWDLDLADRTISHRHVEVTPDQQRGGYHITDISRAGTELNGRGFKTAHLVLGDRIKIGDYWFEFTGQGLRWGDEWSGGSLRATNLRVVVPTSKGPRTILHGLSMAIRSGEFIGILGGSGQGKSTLMNALCGINPATSGGIEVNGVPLKSRGQVRDLAISFVPQDDLVHRELTVEEAIMFSAKLRLRIRGTALHTLVDGVIERLVLGEHRHKRISALSGGQRKRVSIATELLARPSILFLDEPTSGLDPAIEKLLMIDLQRLSLTGVTIVTVTHVLQSAYLFNRICYIHDGRLAFMGKVEEARDFFFSGLSSETSSGGVGGPPPLPQPGSAFGSVSAAGMPESAFGIGASTSANQTPLEKVYGLFAGEDHRAADWEEAYNASPIAARQQSHFPPPPPVVERERPRLGAGFLRSLLLLVTRQWRIIVADRMNVLFLFAQAMLIGGLVGWVSDDTGFRLFLAIIATMWFGCSNAAQQIVGELPIFRRERVSGLGLNSYIQSKFLFLFGITAIQAMLLLGSLTVVASLAHPVEIPQRKFIEDLRKRVIATSTDASGASSAAGNRALTISDDASNTETQNEETLSGNGQAGAAYPISFSDQIDDPEDIHVSILDEEMRNIKLTAADFTVRQGAGGKLEVVIERAVSPEAFINIAAPKPLAPTWSERFAWWTAKHCALEMNLLDSSDEEVEKVVSPTVAELTGEPLEQRVTSHGLSIKQVLWTCLGLRLGALLLAALTGVGLGLLISALAQSATQAVLWVPLVLIPQILLGGFVVTLPEMSRAVRTFSSLMPSFAAERLMEVSHIYGQRVPKLTNQTKIPSFMTNERTPNADEKVTWHDVLGGAMEESYEKTSPHNTAWQNLALLHNRMGARSVETSTNNGVTTKPNTVNNRDDLSPRYRWRYLFSDVVPAISPLVVLGCWIAGSYLVILLSLHRRQYGK